MNGDASHKVADFALRISDFGLKKARETNPQSAIRNPQWVIWAIVLLVHSGAATSPAAVRDILREGNRLYRDNQFAEAVNKYNDALVEQPQAVEPKFNKANSYYRLDDLGEAMDLYQQVAAESKDMALVAKAKYNLGNCYFQRGTKQRDSDLQKALEDMQTSIANWRQVLDLDPQNKKAARNIEVARLTIKDILDQIKKQQEEQKKQQNQQDQQKQQQQNQSQPQPDPNQPSDPNQSQKAQPQSDPNQTKQEQKPEQGKQDQPQEAKAVPDATAQEIIDREQREKKERELLRQRGQYQEVEKDW